MNPTLFPNGCPVCGHKESRVLYKSTIPAALASDPAFYTPTYNKALMHGELSACQGCGFIFISDRPAATVYENVYSEMEDYQYFGDVADHRLSFKFILDT